LSKHFSNNEVSVTVYWNLTLTKKSIIYQKVQTQFSVFSVDSDKLLVLLLNTAYNVYETIQLNLLSL